MGYQRAGCDMERAGRVGVGAWWTEGKGNAPTLPNAESRHPTLAALPCGRELNCVQSASGRSAQRVLRDGEDEVKRKE